jgi:hypothetical protein
MWVVKFSLRQVWRYLLGCCAVSCARYWRFRGACCLHRQGNLFFEKNIWNWYTPRDASVSCVNRRWKAVWVFMGGLFLVYSTTHYQMQFLYTPLAIGTLLNCWNLKHETLIIFWTCCNTVCVLGYNIRKLLAQNLLGCTAAFLIECRPTFQRCILSSWVW